MLKIIELKSYINQYRPFLIFLLKFFSVYIGLTLLYQFYLNQYDNPITFQVDGFTDAVATQTQQLLSFLNYNATTAPHEHQASIKLFINNVYVARIVEGCNALSVIILFAAFVVAFTGKIKHTVLFILGGSLLIHILNVLRIALLSIALLHYPEQEEFLHGVVFPLFIYGVVFGLWVIWVNKFSSYAGKTAKQ